MQPPRLSIAPMMDRTDRHFRRLIRAITRRALLYSEMVTTQAVIHGDREHLLGFDPVERPLALQLGGEDPSELARCARIAEEAGYDEVNLNVGCPSDRVQQGRFGACLMQEPGRVAEGVSAMRAAAALPVTVKHRIGIDDRDRYEDMERFVETVAEADCDRFIVHARKAWLSGVSPKANRSVPPLRHEEVYRLKARFPELCIETNGGIVTLEQVHAHLRHVDGVMIGRAAYDDPFMLATADAEIFDDKAPPPSRREVLEQMIEYAGLWLERGIKLSAITRHMMGLFAGLPGARAWRRLLSTEATRPGAGVEILQRGLEELPPALLDARPRPGSPGRLHRRHGAQPAPVTRS